MSICRPLIGGRPAPRSVFGVSHAAPHIGVRHLRTFRAAKNHRGVSDLRACARRGVPPSAPPLPGHYSLAAPAPLSSARPHRPASRPPAGSLKGFPLLPYCDTIPKRKLPEAPRRSAAQFNGVSSVIAARRCDKTLHVTCGTNVIPMPEPDVGSSLPKAVPSEGGGSTRAKRAAANAEGFLALLLIAVFVGFIYSLRRVTGDFVFEGIVLLLLYSCSWLFAIGGTRRGKGAGKVAAIVALGILVASAVLVLASFIGSMLSRPSA